jgi:hypothetical protein
MSVYDGKYTEKSVNDASFKQDKGFLKPPRAAEGETAGKQGGLEGFTGTFGGFGKDNFKPADGDLKYTNSGGDRKDKSWR